MELGLYQRGGIFGVLARCWITMEKEQTVRRLACMSDAECCVFIHGVYSIHQSIHPSVRPSLPMYAGACYSCLRAKVGLHPGHFASS